jgi:hypothetical protein
MVNRKIATATTPLEGMAVLLDPRFKNKKVAMFAGAERGVLGARRDLVNRCSTMRESDVQEVAPAAAAPPSAAGAGCATSAPRSAKRARLSFTEQRAAQRQEQQRKAAAEAQAAATAATVNEVHKYLAEPLAPWEEDFDLLAYWADQYNSGNYPCLSRVAAQVLAVGSTSCQAERNFSTLGNLLTHLRTSLAPWKVEMLMFLRCNKQLIPEIAKAIAAEQEHAAARAQAAQAVQQVHSV